MSYLKNKLTVIKHHINQIIISKRIRKKIHNGKKIKIGFFVVFDSVFPGKIIFEKLLNSKKYEVSIIVIPDTSRGKNNEIFQLNKTFNYFSKKYKNNLVMSLDCTSGKYIDFASEYDIVCMANPYDAMTHKYYTIEYISKFCLIFYISYYYFGKLNYDLKFLRNKSLDKLWKVFVENINSRELFEKHTNLGKRNIIISGYPKMDEFFNYERIENNEKNQKIIIISPHHTVRRIRGHLNLSNFLRLSDFYLKLPFMFPDIKFIFRPHPLLFVVLSRPELWGEIKVNEYISKINCIPNMIYQDGGEYFESFAKSSALIHDCGSFMAEYLYTSHPQCFVLENKEEIDREFLPFGKEILKKVYTAFTEKDIIDFINDVVINGNDFMKKQRMEFANLHIKNFYPNSSDFIIDFFERNNF